MTLVEKDSPMYTMRALINWWDLSSDGDKFLDACEQLDSTDLALRSKAFNEMQQLLKGAGVSWLGLGLLIRSACEGGREDIAELLQGGAKWES